MLHKTIYFYIPQDCKEYDYTLDNAVFLLMRSPVNCCEWLINMFLLRYERWEVYYNSFTLAWLYFVSVMQLATYSQSEVPGT